VAHAVDLLVDGGVLGDIGIGGGDVSLRLVIIVIGDKVLHGIVREELAELRTELRRQYLVVGDDKCRALQLLDDVGHREGLARARDAQKDLVLQPVAETLHEPGDGRGLVARGLILR